MRSETLLYEIVGLIMVLSVIATGVVAYNIVNKAVYAVNDATVVQQSNASYAKYSKYDGSLSSTNVEERVSGASLMALYYQTPPSAHFTLTVDGIDITDTNIDTIISPYKSYNSELVYLVTDGQTIIGVKAVVIT